MGKLNLSIDFLKKLICLKEEYWEYDFGTNCYAFALGLDVPESDIIKNAYQLGVVGATIYDIPIIELKKMTYEERLLLDLKALKIMCKEVDPFEKSGYDFHFKNGSIISVDHYWLIALFSNGKDFHFLRKNYDGIWYHKCGYFSAPINYDNSKQIIIDPRNCKINEYEYVKTYKLTYKEKC